MIPFRRRARRVAETFDVIDGALTRTVELDNEHQYVHRCSREVFEAVAHAVNAAPTEGTSTGIIARQERLPFTQVNVALEFMKERGLIDVCHRRCYPATEDIYLDAMVEFCALAEESKTD